MGRHFTKKDAWHKRTVHQFMPSWRMERTNKTESVVRLILKCMLAHHERAHVMKTNANIPWVKLAGHTLNVWGNFDRRRSYQHWASQGKSAAGNSEATASLQVQTISWRRTALRSLVIYGKVSPSPFAWMTHIVRHDSDKTQQTSLLTQSKSENVFVCKLCFALRCRKWRDTRKNSVLEATEPHAKRLHSRALLGNNIKTCCTVSTQRISLRFVNSQTQRRSYC